ncbi:MAG: hypothetical protein EOO24_13535 [Comamonadaceae bacterium]|nr:MAG: hypothetical protein EOO24_13535 [Comamonadaceae bacterium]
MHAIEYRVSPRALAVAAIVMALGGCQTRGNFRPLSSEGVPPPQLVDVPRPCTAAETARDRVAGKRCE